MRKIFFALMVSVFLLIPGLNSHAEVSSNVEILIPNTNIIYEFPEMRIVGLIHDSSVTQVNILVNDSPTKLVDVL
ncbi:MAG: hypothetical protein PHX78_12055, partial [bacterium]|nr:hypothetical protein [bacterium]